MGGRPTPQNRRDESLGRFLSLALRHNPEAAGIRLDANGWADVEALLDGCRRAGKPLDRAALERIVRDNDKRRYSFSEDGTRIRANQGHSVDVDVEPAERTPPAALYHGTARRSLPGIREEGIRKRSRRHVHLTVDPAVASAVGQRHGLAVVLRIDAAAMYRDGHRFYVSANGVWLCEHVPWRYASVLEE